MGFSWICLVFSLAFWRKKANNNCRRADLGTCGRGRWRASTELSFGDRLKLGMSWNLETENPMENPRGCHWCHHFPDFYKARNGGIPKLWGKRKKNLTTLASPITKKTWRHQQSPNSLRSHQLTLAKQHTDMKGIEATEWRLDQIELGGIATLYIYYTHTIIYIYMYTYIGTWRYIIQKNQRLLHLEGPEKVQSCSHHTVVASPSYDLCVTSHHPFKWSRIQNILY